MNELSKEKLMTIAEVASVLNVSKRTIINCVGRLHSDKLRQGKTTYLNEMEVALISKELKNNDKVLEQLTVIPAVTVANTNTDLELLLDVQAVLNRVNNKVKLLTIENQKLIQENQLLLPKGDFYDAVMTSDTAIPMNEVAKMLGTGRTRLFSFLREKGVLMQGNLPYQKYNDYFEVKEKQINMNGKIVMKPVTLVTQKGIDYIRKLLDKECNICYT